MRGQPLTEELVTRVRECAARTPRPSHTDIAREVGISATSVGRALNGTLQGRTNWRHNEVMTKRQHEAIEACKRSGSFEAAGKLLGITEAAVRSRVMAAEEKAGCRLVERLYTTEGSTFDGDDLEEGTSEEQIAADIAKGLRCRRCWLLIDGACSACVPPLDHFAVSRHRAKGVTP